MTYQKGEVLRISGRQYRVVNPSTTIEGVPGHVLLGALTKGRGGTAGEGELVAMLPEEIEAGQVVPTSRRTGTKGRVVPIREPRPKAERAATVLPTPTPLEMDWPTFIMTVFVYAIIVIGFVAWLR